MPDPTFIPGIKVCETTFLLFFLQTILFSIILCGQKRQGILSLRLTLKHSLENIESNGLISQTLTEFNNKVPNILLAPNSFIEDSCTAAIKLEKYTTSAVSVC